MNHINDNVRNFFDKFCEESGDLLDEALSLSLKLTQSLKGSDSIHELFRIIHSLKGSAALLGLQPMKKICHDIETILHLYRDDETHIDSLGTQLIYKAITTLKVAVQRFVNTNDLGIPDLFVQQFASDCARYVEKPSLKSQNEMWQELSAECNLFSQAIALHDKSVREHWDLIIQKVEAIKHDLQTQKIISSKIELKEESSSDTLNRLVLLLDQVSDDMPDHVNSEQVLKLLEELLSQSSFSIKEVISEAITIFKEMVPFDGLTTFVADSIKEKLSAVEHENALTLNPVLYRDDEADESQKESTIRVKKKNIDNILNPLGELVIVNEMFVHIQRRLETLLGSSGDVSAIKKNNEILSRITADLQYELSEMRQVPIASVGQKAQHVALNIAAALNKKIDITIEGGDVTCDKDIFEGIQDPIVHLIRNAVDHGIEETQDRSKAGKPERGLIVLRFSDNAEKLIITIRDDGKGVDPDAICKKAIEKGFISHEQGAILTDEQKTSLILLPGFSTARNVTDVSGRGVGLDVVCQNVQKLGGNVVIEGVAGVGTSFVLSIPKKAFVKIVNGFLVTAGNTICVFPVSNVGKSFQVEMRKVTTLVDGGECLMHHGKVYPLIRLASELGFTAQSGQSSSGIGVIIDNGKKEQIVLVDDILGTQQVVLKNIQGINFNTELILGFSILGNEKIAAMIDVDYFFKQDRNVHYVSR